MRGLAEEHSLTDQEPSSIMTPSSEQVLACPTVVLRPKHVVVPTEGGGKRLEVSYADMLRAAAVGNAHASRLSTGRAMEPRQTPEQVINGASMCGQQCVQPFASRGWRSARNSNLPHAPLANL